jgi:TRAP-type mannitol/chloroaromatic compound transport system permease small subunit
VIFDAAADGLHIILAMLIVGFVFLIAVGIGEAVRGLGHRRKARRPGSY